MSASGDPPCWRPTRAWRWSCVGLAALALLWLGLEQANLVNAGLETAFFVTVFTGTVFAISHLAQYALCWLRARGVGWVVRLTSGSERQVALRLLAILMAAFVIFLLLMILTKWPPYFVLSAASALFMITLVTRSSELVGPLGRCVRNCGHGGRR